MLNNLSVAHGFTCCSACTWRLTLSKLKTGSPVFVNQSPFRGAATHQGREKFGLDHQVEVLPPLGIIDEFVAPEFQNISDPLGPAFFVSNALCPSLLPINLSEQQTSIRLSHRSNKKGPL